ncbi:hypothetical protein FACS1894166_03790 [Bacilli bacterium]|nr:hypothetical protein FACS1894166_03790 [Bacilli bacterium]
MLLTLYRDLLKNTISSCINLMGDSAGGNIVLSMAQQLKVLKLPKPANIIAISPAVDFSTNKEVGEQIADLDPVLP